MGRKRDRSFDERDYRPFTSTRIAGLEETINEWIGWKEREERASKLFPKSEVFEHDRLDGTRSLSLPYASPLIIWRLVSVGSVTKLDIN